MIRLVRSRAPLPKTLAQQQADFTAEGAPPPGTLPPVAATVAKLVSPPASELVVEPRPAGGAR